MIKINTQSVIPFNQTQKTGTTGYEKNFMPVGLKTAKECVEYEKNSYLVRQNNKMKKFLQTSAAVKQTGAPVIKPAERKVTKTQEDLAEELINYRIAAKYMTPEQRRAVASSLKAVFDCYKGENSFLWVYNTKDEKLYLWPTSDNGTKDGNTAYVWLKKDPKTQEYTSSAFKTDGAEIGEEIKDLDNERLVRKFEKNLGALPRCISESNSKDRNQPRKVGHLQLAELLDLKKNDLRGGSLAVSTQEGQDPQINWTSRVLNQNEHSGQAHNNIQTIVNERFVQSGITKPRSNDHSA